MDCTKEKRRKLRRRHLRVRRKVIGTAERPRLSVYRSLKHIYAQVVDDETGTTIVAVSTLSPKLREQIKTGSNKGAAQIVGKAIAELAKEKGVEKICFDRGGYKYHGRVKAVAEGARENGLSF